jgi:hypothetical protein
MRWFTTGDLREDEPIEPRGTDDVGYAGAHFRVVRLRGDAHEHACAHCGGPATQWAYDHADPDEQVAVQYRGRGDYPYSLDVEHYLPLCVRCHRLFDVSTRRRGATG